LLAYLNQDLGAGASGGGAMWRTGPFWPLLKNPQNPAKEVWISLTFVLAMGFLIRLVQLRHLRDAEEAL
jgi:hypothetical protein